MLVHWPVLEFDVKSVSLSSLVRSSLIRPDLFHDAGSATQLRSIPANVGPEPTFWFGLAFWQLIQDMSPLSRPEWTHSLPNEISSVPKREIEQLGEC